MKAEGAALPDDPIEEHRCVLRDLVVFDEKFLKLVDDQQRARDRFRASGLAIAGDVLHAALPEHITAALQFLVDTLQHAQSKLAITLDRDNTRVRQMFGGVTLEFDALLEVDEVELDLLGTARQREIGDDDVKER